MKTTQAWGWLAAGVLAAGLNAAYHDGALDCVHRIADRVQHGSAAVVALASGRADQFVAEARLLSARTDNDSANDHEIASSSDATLAKAQEFEARTEGVYARAEAIAARGQAHIARIQAERTRIEDRLAAHRACVRMAAAQVRPAAWSMSMRFPR